MLRTRLSIFYSDDIKTLYGSIHSKTPLVVRAASFLPSFAHDMEHTVLQWHENGRMHCYMAELIQVNEEYLTFKPLKELTGKLDKLYKVEYKGFFDIKKISADEYSKYFRYVIALNSSTKSSMANKLQSAIPTETITNQHLFRFLLEMDSKLEKLLYLTESQQREEALETVKALYISSEGCGFFIKVDIKIGELIFLEARSFDTMGKLRFNAVCKVSSVRKTKQGCHVDAEFIDMEEAVRENIIKYIFEKDRELLNEAREK